MTRFKIIVTSVLYALLAATSCTFANDNSWGDLAGRFIYDGKSPPLQHLEVTKDIAAIGENVPDESLIVNSSNGGIANIVVYLLPQRGTELPVHASYEKAIDKKNVLSIQKGRFKPHVMLLHTSQTMAQYNRDSVAYSPNIHFIKNTPM